MPGTQPGGLSPASANKVGYDPEADKASTQSAMAAIGAAGATAVAHESNPPTALTDPSAGAASRSGILARRWEALKDGFRNVDPRESAAGKAAIAAGAQFSKWDVAKAVMSDIAVATPWLLRASQVATLESTSMPIPEDLSYKVARSQSGVANPVLRRKMAEGLLVGPDSNNPVYLHLAHQNLNLNNADERRGRVATKQKLQAEVRQSAEDIKFLEANPHIVQRRRYMGGVAVGLIPVGIKAVELLQ